MAFYWNVDYWNADYWNSNYWTAGDTVITATAPTRTLTAQPSHPTERITGLWIRPGSVHVLTRCPTGAGA